MRKASPSSRGRGLKCIDCLGFAVPLLSPSSRGRGLKYRSSSYEQKKKQVALFTRAWIEISCAKDCIIATMSPSSRGRGLKYPLPASL